jgi:hypothetical protein
MGALIFTGCEDTNLMLATDAGIDAIKAVTLSDENVKALTPSVHLNNQTATISWLLCLIPMGNDCIAWSARRSPRTG